MKKKDRELINKGLNILQLYIKGKTIGRISGGFIAGGISILGFNNFAPYVTLAIRPELSNIVSLENNALTIIGIAMIIIGALIPPFTKVFNHYRQLYIEDLEKVNTIYSIYDYNTFVYHMNRISNNTSIYDFEIDKIEELFFVILDTNFYFNNEDINQIVKRLGNELSNFNKEMEELRVSPSDKNPNLYDVPKKNPMFNQIAIDTKTDCDRLMATFAELKTRFDSLTKKNIMRFFK
jgi:hypothetical protein